MLVVLKYKQALGEQDGHKIAELSINLDYLALEICRLEENLDGDTLFKYLKNYSLYGIMRDAIDELLTRDYRWKIGFKW